MLTKPTTAALLVALSITSTPSAFGEEDFKLTEIMTISKILGACGVMGQMAAFQSSTKMEGGDAFFERFWRTELTRIGTTPDSFTKYCEIVGKRYEQLYEMAEQVESENKK